MPRWAVIGAWLLLALAMLPLQGPLQSRAADESDTFLARGSESAEAKRIIDEQFRAGSESAAIIAYFRDGGITFDDRQRITSDMRRVCAAGTIPSLKVVGSPYGVACGSQDPLDLSPGGPGLFTSSDSSVALASAAMTDDSTQTAEAAAATIRSIVPSPSGDETGLRAYVTGEVGFEADRSEALKTIDEKLLLVTCAVLILLLLAIYRSPLMVIVLMFGAGTDYCLLLVARFRDELQRTADPSEAIERASAHTRPAILSAGAIVVVAMLVLAVADFNATREMGPILALGIAVMVAAGLTLLPAILGVLGRRAFWPVVPRVEAGPRPVPALWVRIGRLVGRRPGLTAGVVTAILVLGAL